MQSLYLICMQGAFGALYYLFVEQQQAWVLWIEVQCLIQFFALVGDCELLKVQRSAVYVADAVCACIVQ